MINKTQERERERLLEELRHWVARMAEPTKRKVEHPAEALRNEDGIFGVISPYGQVFRVTCKKGHRMRIREIGDSESSPWEVAHHERFDGTGYDSSTRRWQIEKIA